MIKKLAIFSVMVFLIGCAYEGQNLNTLFSDPKSWVQDPHFTDYKNKRDDIESQYLKKELTYAQYLENLKELEDTYSQEVQERNEKIAY